MDVLFLFAWIALVSELMGVGIGIGILSRKF